MDRVVQVADYARSFARALPSYEAVVTMKLLPEGAVWAAGYVLEAGVGIA